MICGYKDAIFYLSCGGFANLWVPLMMKIEFNSSDRATLGVEIELPLVDSAGLGLVNNSSNIIAAIGELSTAVKHELLSSTIEINSRKCDSVAEAETDIFTKLGRVIEVSESLGTRSFLTGTHPFSPWREQVVTDDPRYKRLVEKLQMVARRFNIFGLHIHVGVKGGENCIYIMNRMLTYLPHMLALSANSPFWEGEFTGLKSYRVKVFENLPIGGLPFFLRDWNDYSKLVESYLKTKTIESIRELWWDVRPHPDFGTIEIRICDTPGSIREAMSLAAFAQALVSRLERDYDEGVPFEWPHASVVRENKWRAARYGLDARFLTDDGMSTTEAREAVKATVDWVGDEADSLCGTPYLEDIMRTLERGEGASRQLDIWKNRGELGLLVRDLCDELEAEVEGYRLGAMR